MRAHFPNGLPFCNALVIGLWLGVGAIASPKPVEAQLQSDSPAVVEAEASRVEASMLELPEELEDLREMGEQLGDLLGGIDSELIQQVTRPLGRQVLRVLLDSAPGLSQKAIEIGEQGLAELERRAMEGLEQVQKDLEPKI